MWCCFVRFGLLFFFLPSAVGMCFKRQKTNRYRRFVLYLRAPPPPYTHLHWRHRKICAQFCFRILCELGPEIHICGACNADVLGFPFSLCFWATRCTTRSRLWSITTPSTPTRRRSSSRTQPRASSSPSDSYRSEYAVCSIQCDVVRRHRLSIQVCQRAVPLSLSHTSTQRTRRSTNTPAKGTPGLSGHSFYNRPKSFKKYKRHTGPIPTVVSCDIRKRLTHSEHLLYIMKT